MARRPFALPLVAAALALAVGAGCSPSSSSPQSSQSTSAAKPAESSGRATGGGAPAVSSAPGAPNAGQPSAAAKPAPTATTSTAPAGSGQPVQPVLANVGAAGHQVVYTSSLAMLVDDLSTFPERAAQVASQHGGYVQDVQAHATDPVPSVQVTVRVPPDAYDATMSELRGLARDVRGEQVKAQDVTQQVADTGARIASLQAAHDRVVELLKQAAKGSDVADLEKQAEQLQAQIDQLKSQQQTTSKQADMATIAVTAQLSSAVLPSDYLATVSHLRADQTTRLSLVTQLAQAVTVEDRNSLRDKLAAVDQEIGRYQAQIGKLQQEAAAAHVTLPEATDLEPEAATEDLTQQYISTRVELTRNAAQRAELASALQGVTGDDPRRQQLAKLLADQAKLQSQLQTVQQRASQLHLLLPRLSAQDEAVLAGVPQQPPAIAALPSQIASAWDNSLQVLIGLISGIVFLWWVILIVAAVAAGAWLRRRNQAPPAPISAEAA